MLSMIVHYFFQIVFIILFVYCLMTFIPNINWYNEPFKSVRAFADMCFAPFRKLGLQVGMMDFSPIVAFIALYILRDVIIRILIMLHL